MAEEWEGEMGNYDLVLMGRDLKGWRIASTVVMARCSVLRDAIQSKKSVAGIALDIALDHRMRLILSDASSLSILLLIYYLYTDQVAAIWDYGILKQLQARNSATVVDYNIIRLELQKISKLLQLPQLELAASAPYLRTIQRTISSNFNCLFRDRTIAPADCVLKLKDGDIDVHEEVMKARCGFFALLLGDGVWTKARREGRKDKILIDVGHVSMELANLILRHIYVGEGEQIFDDIEREKTNQFIDFMTEMLSVANEFLLDRLKSICGAVLRPIISLNNCISILADADFYHLHSLKQVIMSFLCRNLETAMEMRLLDDADDFLMNDLAVHARQLQFDFSPVSRSRKPPQTCVDAAAREDGLSIPQYGSSSYISPSVFESLPIGTPSPPFNPYSSPDRSPIPAIHEGEEQFLMDMDEEVPTLPSAVMSVGTPSDALPAQLPVTPTGSSAQLLVSADLPMQGNFSTPPTVTTTGQVWRLASQQNRRTCQFTGHHGGNLGQYANAL
ncbi:hypothetical protein BT69DRAFT_1340037 [Atractiella rhizophila]|nr:hypothetical protein BT69DRAFT_1340037 [Atractiella rhizophila]